MGERVAAIILAAGLSSRMRRFKPLLPLGETAALERAIAAFRQVGVDDVRVVTGHRAPELEPLLLRYGARGVANPRYREGMFSSVAAGVATLGSDVDAFFVLPADVPLVRPTTVGRLLQARREKPADVVYPCFLGRRGHPPLIAGGRAREIAGWLGPDGLKGALARWERNALDVAVADELILRDMDTPDDYRVLRERAKRLEIPTDEECWVLLVEVLRVDGRIVRHGMTVAQVAERLGGALNLAGCRLDIPLLTAAGMLHDLARQAPDHARAGARLLREMGFGAVADLVATHMDMPVCEGGPVSAAEVLYLADKLVLGERCVSLEERFRVSMERHAHEPAALAGIARRLETARAIRKRLESALGRNLAEVVPFHEQLSPPIALRHRLSPAAR